MTIRPGKFEIVHTKHDKYVVYFKAGNGQVMMRSEDYSKKLYAEAIVEILKRGVPNADVIYRDS